MTFDGGHLVLVEQGIHRHGQIHAAETRIWAQVDRLANSSPSTSSVPPRLMKPKDSVALGVRALAW